jgi:hypothetical protein
MHLRRKDHKNPGSPLGYCSVKEIPENGEKMIENICWELLSFLESIPDRYLSALK